MNVDTQQITGTVWTQPLNAYPIERKLHAKLARIMGALDRVPKRGHNDFHNYDYATEADVYEALRKELSADRICVLVSMAPGTLERFPMTEKRIAFLVVMQYTFVDGETGEREMVLMPGYAEDSFDKGLYKALTGSAKYNMLKNFLISTGDDPEVPTAGEKEAATEPVLTRPSVQRRRAPARSPKATAAAPSTAAVPPAVIAAAGIPHYDPAWTGDERLTFTGQKGTRYFDLEDSFVHWLCNKDRPDVGGLKERARRAAGRKRLSTIMDEAQLDTDDEVPF